MNERELETRVRALEERRFELLREDVVAIVRELPKEAQERLARKLIDRWISQPVTSSEFTV
jgi:hypothetical protein